MFSEMNMFIKSLRISGLVTAPASKSLSIRSGVCNFLSGSKGLILNYSDCDDATYAKKALDVIASTKGRAGRVKIDCGESALCLRIFTPLCFVLGIDAEFVLNGSLLSRSSGIDYECLKTLSVGGKLLGGVVEIDASLTSQFLTGLLIALPLAQKDSVLNVKNLKSSPYVDMTLDVLKKYGIEIQKDGSKFVIKGGQSYEPVNYKVEGDFAGASFILVTGAVGGKVKVEGLNYKTSLQPEKKIIDVLRNCGAKVETGEDFVSVSSTGVNSGRLKSFNFDATDNPDLFPPLCALAVSCEGESIIYGTTRLKHKESDRGLALYEEFKKLGADIKLFDDRIQIKGNVLDGGRASSRGDHRICMALAVLGISSINGVEIENADCVNKSYPAFFKDIERIKT